MNPCLRISLLIALAFAGCEPPRPKLKPAPPPTPPLGPPAQRISGERLNAEDAMSFSDLSLLLRMGTPENALMQQIARRGFIDPINPAQAQSLAGLGASQRLIIVVQDRQYVLNAAERQGYLARQQRREKAARGKTMADLDKREAEFAERQQQLQLQQQTFDMVAQKEREQQQLEQAKAAYAQRRKQLEAEIEDLKTRITAYRRSGYRESNLTGMNQQLKSLQDELFNLRSP